MGARVYIPGLGRFLQVDSIEGGTLNNYVYVQDPVNSSDYSGQSWAMAIGAGWGLGALAAAVSAAAPVVLITAAVVVASVAVYYGVKAVTARDTIESATHSQATTGSPSGSGSSSSGSGGSGGGRASAPTPKSPRGPTSIKKAADQIAAKYNGYRSRVQINTPSGRWNFDLKGPSHYVKGIKRRIDTPHKTFEPLNPRNPNTGLGNEGPPIPMDWSDLRVVIRYLTRQ